VAVTGLLRLSEPGAASCARTLRPKTAGIRAMWRPLPSQGLAQAAPFFIDQGLPGQAVAENQWPRPGLTVIQFSNSHAVYALTWYGLALMVLLAAWLVVRHERRAREDAAA
jgi:surfeit locus 1 family protein